MKKVLVLMSTYNGEKYLKEQLNSIINQKGIEVTIRVRDDGSKDETVEIIKRFQNTYSNIELIEGNNIGFALSFLSLVDSIADIYQYDYYSFSDQDDVWLNDKLLAAVNMLETCKSNQTPNLYFSNAQAVDENLNTLFETETGRTVISKPSSLVRYFMLGCTMVFSPKTVEILQKYKPQGRITMHDLWVNQTCIFLGEIVFDSTSHILYRQHGNNTAGVGNGLYKKINRLRKSFKTYERRHFRENNAKNLLSAYSELLSQEDIELITVVANYRQNINNRIKMLLQNDISMDSILSNIVIKIRIILGLL